MNGYAAKSKIKQKDEKYTSCLYILYLSSREDATLPEFINMDLKIC